MEIRRVQFTGGSSYVITLPKEWIKSANIQKNDPLSIFSQSDGTLLITPKIAQKQSKRLKEFKISTKTDQTYLLRRLIGAYIAGYNSIKIKSENRIGLKIRPTVRKFTQITIGQEVIEETDYFIILKDLLDPTEMPFSSTIKRMSIIVKSMHEDAMQALATGNKNIAKEILLRDNDVDRLNWLIARHYNIISQNISLAEKMYTTIGMSSIYFLISRIIERVGDHVVKIAQNVPNLIDGNINKQISKQIQSASDLALDIFNQSIGSFYRRNIHASNQNIETVKKLKILCKEIDTLALKQESAMAISIGDIVESVRRIGEYAEDISETTINYLVGED